MPKIESDLLKAGILSRITDLDTEIKADRKNGIFRSENDVRRDELVNFVLYVIQLMEAVAEQDENEIEELKKEVIIDE